MRLDCEFIREAVEFDEASDRLERVFRVKSEFPDQVFSASYRHFGFEDCDWAMSPDFWPVLQTLMRGSGDDTVLVAVDPDSANSYKEEFGCYSFAKIKACASENDYQRMLNEGPSSGDAVGALQFVSSKVLWLPPSGQWAIWGERGAEICCLSWRDSPPQVEWHDVEWALDRQRIVFWQSGIPGWYIHRLRQNYCDNAKRAGKRKSFLEDIHFELVGIAQAIVDGNIHPVEGARKISRLAIGLELRGCDAFVIMRRFELDTDDYPLGELRSHCAAEYLSRMDARLDEILADARPAVLEACRELIRLFSENPES